MSLQHHFNITIAQKYGIHVALFLDHMAFWITKNVANNHNLHDGACWTRNTVEAYTAIFPYLTPKQIRKVITDCQKYGLLKVGNYNKLKYDRTGWYSLTEYAAKLLNISIFPTGQMDVPKKANGIAPQGKPIPCTNTVTNKERAKPKKPTRALRSPLSDDYYPSKAIHSMMCNVSTTCQISQESLLAKFKNLMRSTGKTSADWDAEFGLFLSREKPSITKPTQEAKSTVTEYHPVETIQRASIDTVSENMKNIRQMLSGKIINAHTGKQGTRTPQTRTR